MTLKEKIDQDIKTAMKTKNQAALRSTRAIKAAILLAETDGSGQPVDRERGIRIIQKLLKQRQDSYDIFTKQDRQDLARKEKEEIDVISKYLPEQLSDQALDDIISAVIDQTGASTVRDMGKVMGAALSIVAGRAENKVVAQKIKDRLSPN